LLTPESLPPSINELQKIKQELEEALRLKNFVRAEFLARQFERPNQEIKELQKKALQQFIVEFRNAEGVLALAKEYKFSKEELGSFLRQLMSHSLATKQFDIKTMNFLNLQEWLQKHFSSFL